MTLHPECLFVVTLTGDEIENKCPDGKIERIRLADLTKVLVCTNSWGPWLADVWWVLESSSPDQRLCFPQGATGEDEVLERLGKLPGFQVRGMNSTKEAEFECWPTPSN